MNARRSKPSSSSLPATVPEGRLHDGIRRLARLDARIHKAELDGDTDLVVELRAERIELRARLAREAKES